jgi:hypothetical protein
MNKILLLSHQRSGTGTYCDAFNLYHKSKDKNFISCINEVYTDQYKQRIDFVKKYNLNSNKLSIKHKTEITKSFLYAFNSKSFILKYFPLAVKNFCTSNLTLEFIISNCLSKNIDVHFLYRKNILKSTLSLLISNFTNIWHKDTKESSIVDYNKILFSNIFLEKNIDYHINEIALCHKYYSIFKKNNLIKNELTYEDNIINKNFKYSEYIPSYYEKLNDENNVKIVLKNNKHIFEILDKYIKVYNLKCSREYLINDYSDRI